MKKNFFSIFILLAGYFLSFGQVGINTDTPKTTLDVVGKATDNTVLDGITAPRLTGAQLRAKTYTMAQTGALVYVTAADTSPAGQTLNVTTAGYFYFDGTKWIGIGTGGNGNSGGGSVDIEVGQTAYYIKKVPCTPGKYMSDYFSDVPVVEGLRMDAYIAEGVGAATRYDPRFVNITANPIKVNYTSIASVDNATNRINKTIQPGIAGAESVDGGGWVYAGTTNSETETIDVVIGNKWYRILYFAYIDSSDVTAGNNNNTSLRTIRVSITRLN